MRKQAVGVAPYVGVNLARYRFYVPYHRLEEARDVALAVSDPESEPEEQEPGEQDEQD